MNQIVSVAQQHDVSDIAEMARAIAASRLFGITSPDQALALCLIAQAEGRHPASAAQDYHIVSGKPSKKADAMLRDFLNSGGKVQWHDLTDTLVSATFSHPAGGSARIDWDMARAKKAQLNTPMWTKFPRQMLRSRVVSEGVRTVFPMATSGMYVPEEVVEFDAPKDVTPPQKDVTPTEPVLIEGSDEPKQKTKYAAKKLMADMIAEMRSCSTVEELGILWNSKPFKAAYRELPDDWQTGENSITAEKEELKAMLNGEHPSQAPNFDRLEAKAEDSLATGQFKASVAMEALAAELGAATDEKNLMAIWKAKMQWPSTSEAGKRLMDVYTAKLATFGVLLETR